MAVARLLWCFFIFCITNIAVAQTHEVKRIVDPEPYAISPNILFIIDASSSLNEDPAMVEKFKLAWDVTTKLIGADEIYYAIYVFHNQGEEKFRPWEVVENHTKQFKEAKSWILSNTGIWSWGQRSIELGLRQKNPLARGVVAANLTIILITDGGFTEAARAESFEPIWKAIREGQKWRVANQLEEATICCVGIENKDPRWGLNVKRPDNECQEFLKKLGTKYKGGYLHVREKPKKGMGLLFEDDKGKK